MKRSMKSSLELFHSEDSSTLSTSFIECHKVTSDRESAMPLITPPVLRDLEMKEAR